MSKIAFVYPGQGVQKVKMGFDFYEASSDAKETVELASKITGVDVKALLYEDNEDINQTEYTQLALVCTYILMTDEITKNGIKPDYTAGLSLGEYAALYATNSLAKSDALALIRKRGILMQNSSPDVDGAMAAIVGLDAETIEEVTNKIEGAYVANYNCPGQIVITGERKALEKCCEELKARGARRALMLNVSGAFHSPYMNDAAKGLEEALMDVEIGKLDCPYVANATGEIVENADEVKGLLVKQVSSSVLFEKGVRRMVEEGVDTIVEIGPGKTVAGFVKKICPEVKVIGVQTLADVETLVEELRG